MKSAAIMGLVLCAFATAVGCGGPPRSGQRSSASDAVILVQSNVPDAELWIDERFVAPVGALRGGVTLRPGTHRVEVRHPGYHSFYDAVTVRARERNTLAVRLVPVLD
jgi:hypothetical protein